jgi:hypothetical protein
MAAPTQIACGFPFSFSPSPFALFTHLSFLLPRASFSFSRDRATILSGQIVMLMAVQIERSRRSV